MSFGFSVGDLFAVGRFAWSVYKSCKEAGEAFAEVSQEVISLHTVLKELEDEIENPDSILNRTGAAKKKELGVLAQNCNGALQQLNKLLAKYNSLGTASKRTWDRLKWGTTKLPEIREKIMSHTSSLTLFLTTLGTGSLGRIEKKLDQLIEDVRAGRREETVLTMADDDADEAEAQWNLFKSELVDDGFTKVELEGHKHWIKARLMAIIESGGLHEDLSLRNGSPSNSTKLGNLKAEKAGSWSVSQDVKQPEPGTPSTRRRALRSTAERAEESKEENQIIKDGTPVQRDIQSKFKVFSLKELGQEDQRDESMPPGNSDQSEDSTPAQSINVFLPSDSVSNIDANRTQGGSRQAFPRKGALGDEHYNSDTADITKSESPKYETVSRKETPRDCDRFAQDYMYRLRRVKEIFRDIEVPPPSPTEKSPHIDLEDNPYDYSRATCYINSQDSQYVDSRGNRGTATHYPGYSARGYDLEIRNPFVPAPSDKYPTPNSNSSSHDRTKGYQVPPGAESGEEFSFSNREAIFADFLHGQGGMGDSNSAENRDREGIKPHPSRLHTPGVTAIERTVQLTLEQLFEGTQKMKKVRWKKFDRDAVQMTPYKDNTGLAIKPGFKKGTRVIFRDVGDSKEDLHLIIDEKPHPVFTRDGDDLHMTIELSLFESLCGWKASVFTIDGKLLDIEKKNPTQPGSHDSYPELGMPSSEARDKRGRFIIHYAVKYPAWLTRREISGLKEILCPKIYT